MATNPIVQRHGVAHERDAVASIQRTFMSTLLLA